MFVPKLSRLRPLAERLWGKVMSATYDEKVRQQIEQYRDINIHDLPEIFHYWSARTIAPVIDAVYQRGSFTDIYAEHFRQCFERTGNMKVLSLGAGDAWVEVDIARKLVEAGLDDFKIQCAEISGHLIERGLERAHKAGLARHIDYEHSDLNALKPEGKVAAVMANQSLHHFVDLEGVMDLVAQSLEPEGRFVSNDTIGRNGHLRWPEAKALVQYFWDELPESYKFHHLLQRFESPQFLDWDCSNEGFEGVRAQDILPMLVERFGFTHFAAWGGLADVFVDRGFGHNFSVSKPADVAFIDKVQALNDALADIGFIKPTQMFAVMTLDKDAPCISFRGMTPERAVRDPSKTHAFSVGEGR